jgi:flavin reductase (DIM6/NTAB) family NADH-FMN oxidoreductase RutF
MKLDPKKSYRLISPRPTVVITTLNSTNVPNACVVSFISPVSKSPPILMISLTPVRHTYKNIIKNGEFVVNILGKRYIDQMLRCAAKYQEGVNKIQQAGLGWYTSKIVTPPRIREASAWLECKVTESKELGDHIAIFGEVLEAEAKDGIIKDGKVDLSKINPVLHISGSEFATDFKAVKHKRYD